MRTPLQLLLLLCHRREGPLRHGCHINMISTLARKVLRDRGTMGRKELMGPEPGPGNRHQVEVSEETHMGQDVPVGRDGASLGTHSLTSQGGLQVGRWSTLLSAEVPGTWPGQTVPSCEPGGGALLSPGHPAPPRAL